jgi:hypothetical protein
MQFRLSTMMLLIAAVAFGCLGWNIGGWRHLWTPEHGPSKWHIGMGVCVMVAQPIALVVSIRRGGRKVLPYLVAGWSINVIAILATIPSDLWKSMNPPSALVAFAISMPCGILFGTVRNAVSAQSWQLRIEATVVALVASFSAGWVAYMIFTPRF